MIVTLRGIVQHVEEEALVLEVGGVGLRIAITRSVLDAGPQVGKPFFLHTALMLRDEKFYLYGFSSAEEHALFEVLIGVSGVGPKLALSLLSNVSGDILRSAVAGNQPEVLTKVPGIGRKTAEKIVFHLKDVLAAPPMGVPMPSQLDTEVLEALTALEYSLVEAQAAIQAIPEDAPEDVEERVRLALRFFAKP